MKGIDLEKIDELMKLMNERGITKISVKEKNGAEIQIEKCHAKERDFPSFLSPPSFLPPPLIDSPSERGQKDKPSVPKEVEKTPPVRSDGYEVTSPMVGTFYASAGPGQSNFVKVGDLVTKDSVVCIIEAMKVMNEVKAGKAGVIAETFVENAHPVEFGTKLFRIT